MAFLVVSNAFYFSLGILCSSFACLPPLGREKNKKNKGAKTVADPCTFILYD